MLDERKTVEDDSVPPAEPPVPRKNEMRLLSVMSAEMTRKEIRDAMKLKNWNNVKRRLGWSLDPCLDQGWIEMTIPEKPRSPKQRFRITPVGRTCRRQLWRTTPSRTLRTLKGNEPC